MNPRRTTDEDFERFVLDAYAGLVRLGTLLTGSHPGGEDLVQTALSRVYVAWPRIADKSAAFAYTRTVMIRQAARWRRRRSNDERPTSFAVDDVRELDRSDEVAVAEAVRRALMVLPISQRAVLVLRYFAMCSESEIADVLRIAPGTVKSRAARGLHTLRSLGLLDREGARGT